jgi:hypothetical protein
MSPEQVAGRVGYFQATFQIADDTAAVTEQLLALLRKFATGGKQVHDANIVATMLVYGLDRLLTQNVDDMRRFQPLIQVLSIDAVANL